MVAGFCDYPDEFKKRYRDEGYWLNATLSDLLAEWARDYKERIALVQDDRRLTYAELDRAASSCASGLFRLGIKKEDRILVQLPNSIDFVICIFALFRLGAIPIMCMMSNRESEVDAFCSLAEPSAYITVENFLGFDHGRLARNTAQRNPCLRHIVTDKGGDGAVMFTDLFQERADFTGPAYDDVALLLLSGGTTGTPKLIPRTHAAYSLNAQAASAACGFNRDTIYLAVLPAAHNFPLCCPGILGTLLQGGRVVLIQTSSPDEAFPAIEKEKVNVTALVPSLVRLWLQSAEWEPCDFSSLKSLQVGGALLDPELAGRVKPTFGCDLLQEFGMAEGLLCCTRLGADDKEVLFTQGRPISTGDELRVVDENGAEVPAGEVGELLVRGPYTIRGYFRADTINAHSFSPDGFYRSGDRVRFTPEGNIQVMGRIKDQINRAGEKISAVEIENHLRYHPNVTDAALVPIPDQELGERSCAFLIPANGKLSLLDIHTFLRERGVPRHQMPDQLEHVNQWPLTAIGKIDKKKLTALAG